MSNDRTTHDMGPRRGSRPAFDSVRDFDPEEVTTHGQTNARVRELHDPDAYVMLGKLASAVARCESTVLEASKAWKDEREEARKERAEARADRARLARLTRRAGVSAVGLAGVLQAVIYALHSAGILK